MGDGGDSSEDEYYDKKEAEIFKKTRKEADSQTATPSVSSKADSPAKHKQAQKTEPQRIKPGWWLSTDKLRSTVSMPSDKPCHYAQPFQYQLVNPAIMLNHGVRNELAYWINKTCYV